MNPGSSMDLLLYGGMLLGLGALAPHLSHAVAATQWVGFGGGVVAALLGLLGLRGHPVRHWAIVAMTVLTLALLLQSVTGWLAVTAGVEAAKGGALIQTVLGVFAIVQLVNLVQNKARFPFDADGQ